MTQSNNINTSPQHLAYGHAAPIYGILSASLGISPMDSCRVFAFGVARDSVSAAVRLNLIGPTEGLSILDSVGRRAVEKGLEEGLLGVISENLVNGSSSDELAEKRDAQLDRWLRSVATCAPLMDTIQPLHDLLSLRLFKT
jgi:urease accessory protein UreF